MTEIDKKTHISLKKKTVKRLQAIDVDKYNLSTTDERLPEYIKGCITNPDGHNLYELLAIVRFFDLLDRYDYLPKRVKAFIVVYEFLKFSGTAGATRYKLTPIQVFQVANMRGFFHKNSNKRLIRDALLFVPRKFSKTTSVAAFAIEDLLFGEANAQAYVAANGYKQAQICFGEIKAILRRLDKKHKRFKVNREKVFNLAPGKTSFAECLSSNPDKLDGLNASTVIVDEYAQADSADLKNVLTSSMGARLNPMTIIITTASDKQGTPFTDLLSYYKKVLRGEVEDDSIFAHIFQPDVGDDEFDVKTWYKVQPHLGITVYEDFYHNMAKKVNISADDKKEFYNKLLNVFTHNLTKAWITREQIEDMFYEIDTAKLKDQRCVASVDLSVSDDFSAVTYTFYLPDRYYNNVLCPLHSITDYYFPEAQLKEHRNREIYKRWIDAGHLKLCKGSVIDYDQIANDLLGKPFLIMGVGYDTYKSAEFTKLIEASGGKEYLYPIKQTYGNFTSPVESFELALHRKQITFDPNPITSYCFSNAIIDEDRMENRKPMKAKAEDKIDGAITNVMNFWLLNNVKQ